MTESQLKAFRNVFQESWMDWWTSINKPSWTPSPSTIGLVWNILYPIITLTFGFVFYETYLGNLSFEVAKPFVLNFFFNLLFSVLFFFIRSLQLCLLDQLAVIGTLLWSMHSIYEFFPLITYLQIPYLIWMVIATTAQYAIVQLN